MWSSQEILALCKGKTASYQERKFNLISEHISGRLPNSPDLHDDLVTVGEKVQDGITAAKRALAEDQTPLIDMVDSLEDLWISLRNQFLVVSIGLSAFSYRSDEIIRQQLMEYRRQMQPDTTTLKLMTTPTAKGETIH